MVNNQQALRIAAASLGVVGVLFLVAIIANSRFAEPTHAAARLKGNVTPKICGTGGSVVALLPDGRLWVSKVSTKVDGWRVAAAPEGFVGQDVQRVRVPIPEAGGMLPGEWIDVECSGNDDWAPGMDFGKVVVYGQFLIPESHAVAIRADGHLERMAWNPLMVPNRPPRIERIGSDSDWKSFLSTGSAISFYPLKTDATLWAGDFPGLANVRDGVDPVTLTPPKGVENVSQYVQQLEADRGQDYRLRNSRGFRLRNGTLERRVETRAETALESSYSPLSRYSDWIAADGRYDLVALASDGTICGWPNDLWKNPRMPALSSRPLWCLNVTATEERN